MFRMLLIFAVSFLLLPTQSFSADTSSSANNGMTFEVIQDQYVFDHTRYTTPLHFHGRISPHTLAIVSLQLNNDLTGGPRLAANLPA